MDYTIKQAAELLNLTKAGVRYHLRALGEITEKDEKGRVIIPESLLTRIRESIAESEPESTAGSGKRFPESEVESGGELSEKPERKAESAEAVALAVLREQIAVKDAQIKSLTAQLESVTEALKTAQRSLEGAQALHAATVKQLQEAQKAQAEPESEKQETETRARAAEDPEEEPKPRKRTLWERITGKGR